MARLLILTPSHSTQGGVERIIEALAQGLPARGFEVVVGLAQGARFHRPELFRAAFPSLATVVLDDGTGTRTGRIRGVQRGIERVHPELVLLARLFDGYPAVALAKLRQPSLRLAVTIQSFEPEYLIDLASYAELTDLCVCAGRLTARAAQELAGLPPQRIVNIGGGVPPASRCVVHQDARPLRLGYVGRLDHDQKRALDLVATLSTLEEQGIPWTCRVAGAGPLEGQLRSAVTALGFEGRVSFDGWLETRALYETVYPELDVLLHFAAFEGMPIAPREAMAHGVVPVVSRFVGCLSEGQFTEGRTALTFPVGNTAAAAAAVQRLHHDRGLLRRLSEAARASQGGAHSSEGALDAWAQALRATLELPPRASAAPPLSPPAGRLQDWGVPESWGETLRSLVGRRAQHRDPGSEWPHWSGQDNPQLRMRIAAFAQAAEALASPRD